MSKTAREVIADHIRGRGVYSGFPDEAEANLEFSDDAIAVLEAAGFVIVTRQRLSYLEETARQKIRSDLIAAAQEDR